MNKTSTCGRTEVAFFPPKAVNPTRRQLLTLGVSFVVYINVQYCFRSSWEFFIGLLFFFFCTRAGSRKKKQILSPANAAHNVQSKGEYLVSC